MGTSTSEQTCRGFAGARYCTALFSQNTGPHSGNIDQPSKPTLACQRRGAAAVAFRMDRLSKRTASSTRGSMDETVPDAEASRSEAAR